MKQKQKREQQQSPVHGHTLGPWAWSGSPNDYTISREGRPVAQVSNKVPGREQQANARLIAQAPALLSQRDRLAAALRGMLSGAEYVNSRAKAGQRAFMSQTACDDARALLAEIDGEGEA